MNERYEPRDIEPKWQELWRNNEIYKVVKDLTKPKYYCLDMFPYPSGAGLHVGHPRGYVASDVFSRAKRMQGFNVLHPMGFDSFGLPAEQYAINTGNNPGPFTEELIVTFKKQLEMIGMSYDWSREVATHRPDFYRWTQWIFLRLYNHYYDTAENRALPIERLIEHFSRLGSANVAASHTPHESFTADQWNTFSALEQQQILMNYRLTYEGYAEVNWCPELGTVLANDEVVLDKDGKQVSERGGYPVIKKPMRQWFMRITAYADRLLSGLDALDWDNGVKTTQRNWIGKSEGSEIIFAVVSNVVPADAGISPDSDLSLRDSRMHGNNTKKITVFTTRPDTIYGATYVVLAPEHKLVEELKESITNWSQVSEYIEWTRSRGEDDRIATKDKTGICLEGVHAINPANSEQVPVWIADYVLASYGAGAVMAVPAHDERDWEFAQKYNLPVTTVIELLDINRGPLDDAYREGLPVVERSNVVCIVESPDGLEYLCAVWKQVDWRGFVTGGIDDGQSIEDTARTEVAEETGYHDIATVTVLNGSTHGMFYHVVKNQNRLAHYRVVHVKLASLARTPVSEEEQAIADFVWVERDAVHDFLKRDDMKYAWKIFTGTRGCYTEYGVLVNSSEYTGRRSEDVMVGITEQVGGRRVTKFKMRDAIFARQRYWGEPMPLRHTDDGNVVALSDDELPLVLPELAEYLPTETGEPPLARSQAWLDAGYETNTMPGWAGSSWYWLRYMDPHNTNELASQDAISYWQNVDLYVGGKEHTTGHLLYSRFWNKFLFDIGIAPTEEPFKALRNQGMILASDGRKMSKRWGNTVTPDEMIERFGADTFRLYQCFIGPFDASQPWIIDGLVGCRRFVEKVWRLAQRVGNDETSEKAKKILHKTIKKVTEDIAEFKFNTAVSGMMECINTWENSESISIEDFVSFLKLLAPFAPHVSDELHQMFAVDSKTFQSIVMGSWPEYNAELLVNDVVTIALSINGKPRGELDIELNASQEDVLEIAKNNEVYIKWTSDKVISKIVFVPNKIINIIVQ